MRFDLRSFQSHRRDAAGCAKYVHKLLTNCDRNLAIWPTAFIAMADDGAQRFAAFHKNVIIATCSLAESQLADGSR
jgi:hypothetical protein